MKRGYLKANIFELEKKIEICENYKKEIIKYVQRAKVKYTSKEITYFEYAVLLNKKLEGKTIKEWFDDYDSYIKNCRKKIKQSKIKAKTKKVFLIFFSLLFISFITLSFFYLKPIIIGLVTEEINEDNEEFISNVNVTKLVDLEIKEPDSGNKIMEFDIPEGQITLNFNLLDYTKFVKENSEEENYAENFDINVKKNAEKYKWGYELKLNDLYFMAKINVESNENIEIIGNQILKIGNNYVSFADLVEQGYIVNIKKPIVLEKEEVEKVIEKEEIEKGCVYSQTCGEWGDCINDYQTRICVTINENCSESEDTETKDCIAKSPFKEVAEEEVVEEEVVEEETEEIVEEEVEEICEEVCEEVCEETCKEECHEEESCHEECSGEGEEQICKEVCEIKEVCEEVCEETCKEECKEVCKIPEELFDITFELEEDLLKESSDLVVWITLQNFGKRYVPARLIYIITNEEGEEAYKKFEETRVYTDKFTIKKFDDLILEEGNYDISLKVEYAGITEEFEDTFIVKRNIFYKVIRFFKGIFRRITGSVVSQERKIVSVYIQKDLTNSSYNIGDIINLDPTLTIIVPEEINITSPVLIKEIPGIKIQKNNFFEIKISEYFSNAEQYYMLQIENVSTTIHEHVLKIIPDAEFTGIRKGKIIAINSFGTAESNYFNITVSETVNITILEENITEISTTSTTQQPAKIGSPVKWNKQIQLEKSGVVKIRLPKQSENIIVNKITKELQEGEILIKKEEANARVIKGEKKLTFNAILNFFKKVLFITPEEIQQEVEVEIDDIAIEYEIEYETPAPYIIEEEIERGKKIKAIGPEDIHYENVLAFTKLNENLNIKNPSRVKIYWVENDSYVPIQKIQDINNNGVYDYIEWVIPYLSNQTFEIIVITKAEHLDNNKNFISDIYEELEELDNVWSETIPNNHYVRVTFESNLTNENDITLYPRIVNGNPKIEVYEFNRTELIAEFTKIIPNEYNKIYLTNLMGSQDVFDLRVVGGSVEIDHIIDPTTNLIVTACDSEGTGACTVSNIDTSDANYETLDKNEYWIINYTDLSCNTISNVTVFLDIWAQDVPSGETVTLTCSVDGTTYDKCGTNTWVPAATETRYSYATTGVTCANINDFRIKIASDDSGGPDDFYMDYTYVFVNYTEATADEEYPQFSNYVANPLNNSNYSYGTDYKFNVTIINTNGTAGVEFEGTNYSASNISDIFNTTITDIGAGTYSYYWWAYGNGTSANFNISGARSYTVAKNIGEINGTINSTQGNFTAPEGSATQNIYINATNMTGYGTGKIYINGTLCNSGTLPLFNVTNLSAGFYNITFEYDGNQNYTSDIESWWVNATVEANNPPQIIYVESITNINPIESSSKTITFNVTMYDPDGVEDLNDTSVNASFSMTGETTRYDSLCSWEQDVDSNSANYTCSIDMMYWDGNGDWNIDVSGTDLGNQTFAYNDTTTLQYNLLQAIVISPNQISFDVKTDAINQTAIDDPTVINNTGNANVTSGNVKIIGINLYGESEDTIFIGVGNFSVDIDTGSSAECDGTTLQNGTEIGIANAVLPRGNLSEGGGIAQEEFYYCIKQVPPIPSQIYSTSNAGSWTIKIIASFIFVFTSQLNNKKKKQKKKKIKSVREDKLLDAVDIIINKLKEEYP